MSKNWSPSAAASRAKGSCHSHGVCASAYSAWRLRPSQIVPAPIRNGGASQSMVMVWGRVGGNLIVGAGTLSRAHAFHRTVERLMWFAESSAMTYTGAPSPMARPRSRTGSPVTVTRLHPFPRFTSYPSAGWRLK